MSLRCIGSQLLQTSPSPLLSGASKVSVSFWVLVNSANNITAANGVEIFGDTGGKFSATLSGTGNLRLQWSFNDGHVNGVSTCLLTLAVGTSYHLASTWQSGSQQYFVNGVSVQPDTKLGTLGLLGDSAPHPFRVGSDQPGADVTLEEPTFWIGYALTAQDVLGLCRRTTRPQGIASPSIALCWSLAGANGVTAQVGDAGLADTSTTRLNLSSIVGTSPTYLANDLTYVPVPVVGSAAIAPSGKSLVLIFQDGVGNNSAVTALRSPSEIQTVALNAIPSGSSFTLSYGGQSTVPIAVSTAPPINYGLWTFPTIAGHSYRLGATMTGGGGGSSQYLHEVMDGGTIVASKNINGRVPFTGIVDPDIFYGNGNPVSWGIIATGIVPSGSTLQIRVTGSTDGFIVVDGLRVEDLTAGTVVHFDDSSSNFATVPATNRNFSPPLPATSPNVYGGNVTIFGPSGVGNRIVVTGGAASIQSALQSLPAIGGGNIAVADISTSSNGTYQVTFSGNLANVPKPMITCADPAVTISRTNVGGVVPTMTITPQGGTAGPQIPLYDVLWSVRLPYSAVATYPFPQSAPAVQTMGIYSNLFTANGYWPQTINPSSYSGATLSGRDPSYTANFPYKILPPGTYRFAATWPASASLSTTTQFLIKDAAGNVLETLSVDQTQAPADYSALGLGWKYIGGTYTTDAINNGLTLTMNTLGSSTRNAAIDAIQFLRTSADTSVVVQPTDLVTITTSAGWATTKVGVVPSVTAQAVAPPSATSILPAFIAGPKTAKIGYNVEPSAYYNGFPVFSNVAVRIDPNPSGVVAKDLNGYPTKISQPQRDSNGRVVTNAIVAQPPYTPQGKWQGISGLPNGLYVMTWDGDASHALNNYGDGAVLITEVISRQNLTGTTGNRRVYNMQAIPKLAYSPGFSLEIHGHAPDPLDPTGKTDLVNLTNLKIYPPDPADPTGNTEWANPPKFHPSFLYKLQGAKCLRFLDPLATNDNNWRDLSHFKPSGHLDRGGTNFNVTIAVAKIQEPKGDRFFTPGNRVVQITTATPHGLFDGAWMRLNGCGTATFSDGSTQVFDASAGCYGVCKVIDATNLLFLCSPSGGPQVTMTNILSGGNITNGHGTIWPIQDIIDLAAATGVPEIWFNVTSSADTSVGGGVDQVFTFLAANLPSGVKVHVEYGNECWNFGSPQYYWNRALDAIRSGHDDGSYQITYANRAQVVHQRAQAMFTAAGRPNDIIYTYATQGAAPVPNTVVITQQAQANNARMDELAAANYFDNWDALYGYENSLIPLYNRMTPDHLLDYMEVNTEYGHYDTFVSGHLPYLASTGFASTKMVFYEAAPDILVTGTPPSAPPADIPNYFWRQNAVKRHPRMYGIMLRMIQRCQDAGLALWIHFNIGGGSGAFAWDAFEWWNQQRGTGNQVLDAINVTDPEAMNQVFSEVGGALYYWSSLASTTTGTRNQNVRGRNGQIKSIGLPKGMNKPIR